MNWLGRAARFSLALTALGAATLPVSCRADKGTAEAPQKTVSVTLVIEGTTCGGCAQHIEEALSKLDGVVEAKASHDQARAWVTYDGKKLGVPDLVQTIEKAGYKARIATEAESTPPPDPAKPAAESDKP